MIQIIRIGHCNLSPFRMLDRQDWHNHNAAGFFRGQQPRNFNKNGPA